MTWNSNIPLLTNQLNQDWPDINENFTHLKDFLNGIVNKWDDSTATNMFIAKTKRTALTNADSPYTMLTTDVLMEVDASGGAVTINALSAATLGAGRFFIVKVTDASNNVTIDPDGSETIDGDSTLVISTSDRCYMIYSDGTNLQVMSSHIEYDSWLDQAVKTTSDPTFNSVTISATPGGSPSTNKIYKDSIVKAWINFNGEGTIAINDSFNVSSITDNGTGDYTITWDTDFADTSYAVAGLAQRSIAGAISILSIRGDTTTALQTGSARVIVVDTGATAVDAMVVSIIAIGNQ